MDNMREQERGLLPVISPVFIDNGWDGLGVSRY